MKTIALRKSKYAKLYSWLIVDIKEKYGISVRHKELPNAFGKYNTIAKIITIDKEIAGTVFSIFILFHELKHTLDEKNEVYPDFYKRLLYGDTKGINIEKLVWKVEWGCCHFAMQQIEKLGIESTNQFCNERWVKKVMLPIWVSYYTSAKN